MLKRHLWFALFLYPALLLAHAPQAHAQLKWAALLQNGELIQGNGLNDWHTAPGTPHLDGNLLLQPENPFVWLRDRDTVPHEQPQAYVEFAQGDILPGEVTAWRSRSTSPYDTQEEFFIVRTAELLGLGSQNRSPEVRISPQYVRRIVWQPLPNTELKPGTLFYRNGRQLEFRSWRGSADGISVLSGGGLQHVPFEEIAELHLPAPDFWESYCDEVAALLPHGEGRLYTLHTVAGMVATGSLEQLQVLPGAGSNQPDQWTHGIQPIWSLDALWIRGSTVWLRQSYLPNELPLNKLMPTEEVETDLLGAAPWPWRRDLNVQGGKLNAATVPYGWGFGVHAPSRLVVKVPAAAQSLVASVAIDDITGDGGCAQARVLAGWDGRVLFESPLLLGTGAAVATGPLDISGLRVEDDTKAIVFDVDPALHNRPEGADPLDIRDHIDWLDPRVMLDPAALAAELEKRGPEFVDAWAGWNVEIRHPEELNMTHAAVEPTPISNRGLFRYATNDYPAGLVLSKDLPDSTEHRWLLISAQVTNGDGARIEIRADGLPIASFEPPNAEGARQNPGGYLLPLAPLDGIAEKLEIVVRPRTNVANASPIVWKCVRIIDQLPMVYAVFEDDPALLAPESREIAEIITDEAQANSGYAALQITAEEPVEFIFPQPIVIAAEPNWGEYRYLRFALRKLGGTTGIEFLHTSDEDIALAYEAGDTEKQIDGSIGVFSQALGGDWVGLTRDMYSDFCEPNNLEKIEITGIRLSASQGDVASFDGILLSRRSDGFDSLAPPPSPEYQSMVELLRTSEPAMADTLNATAHLVVEGRHTTALCIDPEGYLVTSGDIAGGVGREATVYFRDFSENHAVVHAIDRERNLALWKIAEPGPWPAVTLATTAPQQGSQAVAISQPQSSLWVPLSIVQSEIATSTESSITLTADPHGGNMNGRVLVGLDGQVLAVAYGMGAEGTLSYKLASLLAGQLDRLKQGGSYGSWQPHTTPKLGLTVTPAEGGLQITAVEGNTPAATIGLQANDILTKFDGQAVPTVEAYEALLRQRDAGQTIALEVKRGEEILNLTPTLLPLPL